MTLSNRDSGSHYFRFGYSDNMNTRGMIQYYRPNLASSEDELRFWVGGAEKIRFTSTGGIGIATVGDGSTNGSIGVGSTGQVLTSQGTWISINLERWFHKNFRTNKCSLYWRECNDFIWT